MPDKTVEKIAALCAWRLYEDGHHWKGVDYNLYVAKVAERVEAAITEALVQQKAEVERLTNLNAAIERESARWHEQAFKENQRAEAAESRLAEVMGVVKDIYENYECGDDVDEKLDALLKEQTKKEGSTLPGNQAG